MIITLNLGASNYLKHNEVITIPEDGVELLFEQTAYSVGVLVLTVAKGEKVKQYRVNKAPINISEFFTEAGEVSACLSLSVRGEVARVWQIEPFCAKEIPNGIKVVPEVEALKGEIKHLKQALYEISNIITEKEN
jgi:hypothetical protein